MLIFPSMMSPKQCGRFFFGLVSLGLCCLALPEEVLAWGPGVHMVTGNWVLQNLTALSPAMAALLMRYPGQFLHGCLSADIFIGKGSVAREGHSHNWDSAFALLRRADRGRRKAYAYGYLAHLAADTVAHNVYVPESFARAPGSGRTWKPRPTACLLGIAAMPCASSMSGRAGIPPRCCAQRRAKSPFCSG